MWPCLFTSPRDRRCLCSFSQDGWVLFKAVVLKKRLTATDFYNGYLHQSLKKDTPLEAGEGRFISRSGGAGGAWRRKKSTL